MYCGLLGLPHIESIFQQVVLVYEPTGMDGSPKITLTPGLVKSARLVMPLGLPGVKITIKLLVVNVVKLLFRVSFELFSWVFHFWSADINTSQGEPEVIWVWSVLDPALLTIKLQLLAVSKALVMLATTLVKLAAMKTRRSIGVWVLVGVGVI